MAANINPIYSKNGDVQWGPTLITTANTAKDGTGAQVLVFTADATNGGRIEKVRACPTGTATASVLRLFLNNGSTNATPANNILFAEVSLPAITLSEVAEQAPVEVLFEFALPAGYKINATIGTTVAAGWALSAIGGKY